MHLLHAPPPYAPHTYTSSSIHRRHTPPHHPDHPRRSSEDTHQVPTRRIPAPHASAAASRRLNSLCVQWLVHAVACASGGLCMQRLMHAAACACSGLCMQRLMHAALVVVASTKRTRSAAEASERATGGVGGWRGRRGVGEAVAMCEGRLCLYPLLSRQVAMVEPYLGDRACQEEDPVVVTPY